MIGANKNGSRLACFAVQLRVAECKGFRAVGRKSLVFLVVYTPQLCSERWRCGLKTVLRLVFALAVFFAVVLPALGQGTYTQLDVPGSIQTYIFGVNGAGDIVGQYEDTSNNFHGFLLSGGVYTTIDYPGTQSTSANGINDVGQIVGSTFPLNVGFLYDVNSQTFTQIKYPANGSITVAFGINNGGTIVG